MQGPGRPISGNHERGQRQACCPLEGDIIHEMKLTTGMFQPLEVTFSRAHLACVVSSKWASCPVRFAGAGWAAHLGSSWVNLERSRMGNQGNLDMARVGAPSL